MIKVYQVIESFRGVMQHDPATIRYRSAFTSPYLARKWIKANPSNGGFFSVKVINVYETSKELDSEPGVG